MSTRLGIVENTTWSSYFLAVGVSGRSFEPAVHVHHIADVRNRVSNATEEVEVLVLQRHGACRAQIRSKQSSLHCKVTNEKETRACSLVESEMGRSGRTIARQQTISRAPDHL